MSNLHEILLQHFHESIVINLAMKNLPLILKVLNLNFVDFSGSWLCTYTRLWLSVPLFYFGRLAGMQ